MVRMQFYRAILVPQAGDKICILSKVNEQWLCGQCGGSQGTFPASFVDMVPLDLPFHDPATASEGASGVAQLSQPSWNSDKGVQDKVCASFHCDEYQLLTFVIHLINYTAYVVGGCTHTHGFEIGISANIPSS